MNTVTLVQDGTLLDAGTPVPDQPLRYLGDRVELDPGCTLRSLFRLLGRFPELVHLNRFFPACIQRVQQAPASGCTTEAIERLELCKTVEMIGAPGKPRLEIYTSFQGVCGGERVEVKSIPIETLIDMPMGIGRLRHIVFGDQVDVFEFDTVYTLFEFIDGIGWELSFHGTPLQCELRRRD